MRTKVWLSFAAIFLFLGPSACNVACATEGPIAGVHVAANRSQYDGSHCPVDIIYTATVTFAPPRSKGLVFNYHWERSDGAKGPQRVVHLAAGQRSMVLRETWHLGARGQHYNAATTFFANTGNTHISQASPIVSVTCK